MKSQRYFWVGTLAIVCVLWAGAAVIVAQNPAQDRPAQAPAAQTTSPDNAAPIGPPPDDPQDPRYRLNVEVELVNVTATVLDEGGKYMDGLQPSDFELFENGEQQKISFFSHDLRVPISVGVLLDASGSMRHKLQQALQTVREIALALSQQDEMFLISFNNDVNVRQHFTSNIQEIQRSLRDIRAGGETAAYDAVQVSMEEMKKAKHNKKILLMITDGFDTRSHINAEQTEEILKRSGMLVYAIGIDDDDDDPLALQRVRYHIYSYMLARLSGLSGGRYFRMFTGRNYSLNSLASLLMEELHQQYTLSYYPPFREGKNDWRKIDVKVKKTGSQIRHRDGFYLSQATTNPAANP
jgi:Ca-activated chloride channel homolog